MGPSPRRHTLGCVEATVTGRKSVRVDRPSPRVLVAEDDQRLGRLLAQSLGEAGWQVDVVGEGSAAFDQAVAGSDEGPYDVLLLDWMLPERDGLSVCRAVRSAGVVTPVLILTARGSTPDKVAGLDAGADDYLAKPFDIDELLARLRALHRRTTIVDESVLEVSGLRLDPAARRVERDGLLVDLSAREFDILELLMHNTGRCVARYTILDEVWDGEADLRSNVIDVHIASLRAKVDRPFGADTITTVRGVGYRIDAPTG